MGAVIFSGSTVKTLKSAIDINGNAQIHSGSVDPTSSAVSAPVGSVYLNTSNGKLYRKLDAGSSTNWVELGSGSSGKNYITNPNFEANTTGWAAYADAAGASPVDGTGGSPTVTITRSTSSPLSGIASGLITKDASNRQGEGVAFPFLIDAADQGKVLSIQADYAIASGTYSGGTPTTDSDVVAYIVDVTNGTVIQPVSFKLDGAVVGQNYSLRASFQAASNSVSYRLVFHVATTSASAYVVKIDSVSVGPQLAGISPIVTSDQAYTPTLTGFGTATNVEFIACRRGNRLRVTGKFTAGTVTGVEARIGLPTGLLTADSTVIPSIRNFGVFARKASVTDAFKGGLVIATAGVAYVNITSNGVFNSSTSNPFTAAAGTDGGNGDIVAVDFEVPIAGWAGTAALYGQDDGRAVVMSANANTGALSTSYADITTWNDNVRDSHSSLNQSTGVYTVPHAGWYKVHARLYGSDAATSKWAGLKIVHNSTDVAEHFDAAGSASNAAPSVHADILCNAGDTIKIQGIADAATNINTTAIRNTFSIRRSQGPSQVGARETVACGVTTSTTAVGTGTAAAFTVKLYDTHGAFVTDTFTAPAPGVYSIKAATYTAGAHDVTIYKNGTLFAQGNHGDASSVSTVAVDILLAAGDTIQVRDGTSVTLSGGATLNHLMIHRVG